MRFPTVGNILLIAISFVVGCAPTGPSTMQKRVIESHLLQGSYRNVYKASMTVFQDEGYQIKNSDMESGLLVCSKDKELDAGSQIAGAILFGSYASKGSVFEVSSTFDEVDSLHTNVRVNIQQVKYDMSGRKQSSKDVVNQPVIQRLLEAIQTEVKRREAISGTSQE